MIKARAVQKEAHVGNATLARHLKKFGIEPIVQDGVRFLQPFEADLLRVSFAEITNAQREIGARGAAAREAGKVKKAPRDLSQYVKLFDVGREHGIARETLQKRAKHLGIEILRHVSEKGGRPAAYVLASDFARLCQIKTTHMPAVSHAFARNSPKTKLTPEEELKQHLRRIKILVSNFSGDVEIVITKENGHEVKAEITRMVVQTETLV